MIMSSMFKSILNRLKLTDEGEDDDDIEYGEYIEDYAKKEKQRAETLEKKEARKSSRQSSEDEPAISIPTETRKERLQRIERSHISKVVPIRTTPKGFEVCIMKPTNFEDSQDICDMLLSGRAAVINLEGFDVELAQRIMDFISGSVYAMNGKLHQISSYIFIISPDTVDISGDYLDLIPDAGFEVPTLNKDF